MESETEMTTVANLNHRESFYTDYRFKPTVYIGRKNFGMHYGNPFSHLPLRQTKDAVQVKTRQEAVDAFRDWLDGKAYQDVETKRRAWILENMHLLKDKVLLCYCAPELCHGDVYAEKLDFILQSCETCLQLTNHLHGVCQKCKK